MPAVIEVKDLHKKYGRLKAVDGISFDVEEGEIFGIAGPNGAGKTTTVESIEGLRDIDSGTITVLGCNPHRDPGKLKRKIGIQLQESMLPDRMRVKESLHLFARLYNRNGSPDHLLDELGLRDK